MNYLVALLHYRIYFDEKFCAIHLLVMQLHLIIIYPSAKRL